MEIKIQRKMVGQLIGPDGTVLATADIVDEGEDCLGQSLDPDSQEPYYVGTRHEYKIHTGVEFNGTISELGFALRGDSLAPDGSAPAPRVHRFRFKEPVTVLRDESITFLVTTPAGGLEALELDGEAEGPGHLNLAKEISIKSWVQDHILDALHYGTSVFFPKKWMKDGNS